MGYFFKNGRFDWCEGAVIKFDFVSLDVKNVVQPTANKVKKEKKFDKELYINKTIHDTDDTFAAALMYVYLTSYYSKRN